jgi:hypothetical protein
MKNMTQVKDECGARYGRLVVICGAGADKYGNAMWLCVCDCGGKKTTVGMNLRKGLTRSCGCLQREKSSKIMRDMSLKHGMSRTPEYKSHYAMRHTLAKRKQIPPWANNEKIMEIYANRPAGYHVDHIVPLQGEIVCGLHVENNLQYLPARENMSKQNHFEVT